MLTKKTSGVVAIAGVMTVTLLAPVSAAIGGSPSSSQSRAEYRPVQSISYEFGSKSMSGYFVQEDSACLVMLMIGAKGDPEISLPPSPTRIRLALNPGQIAGLDSEEGRSLNVTCGADAATLIVERGDTRKLIARQSSRPQRDLAERS
ncbi:MAG: hypothetical protein ACKVOI_02315 [Dongiaceae bacterium]